MKKISAVLLAVAVFTMAGASAACASPLQNYNAGRLALDAGLNIPSSLKGGNYKLSKSSSAYLGASVGLGGNTALNYKWENFKGNNARTHAQQLNLMYKIIPNLSAYIGYVDADTDAARGGHLKRSGQVGLQAFINFPMLCTLWGNVGYGNKHTAYEIGVAKPLLPNLDLNLSYYDHKFKDALADGDLRGRGINVGLTIKL